MQNYRSSFWGQQSITCPPCPNISVTCPHRLSLQNEVYVFGFARCLWCNEKILFKVNEFFSGDLWLKPTFENENVTSLEEFQILGQEKKGNESTNKDFICEYLGIYTVHL